MKTITKKQSQIFVDKLCAKLIEVGAKKVKDTISTFRKFELETIVGKLTISVDTDNIYCYTMFSRFEDIARAKVKFTCNPYSGKYNTHVGKSDGMTPEKAVEICMIAIECTLPKELA
jgi:hypothetical protein